MAMQAQLLRMLLTLLLLEVLLAQPSPDDTAQCCVLWVQRTAAKFISDLGTVGFPSTRSNLG